MFPSFDYASDRLNRSQVGDAFIVADVGGGTLDVNTYEVTHTRPLQVEEMVEPDCV